LTVCRRWRRSGLTRALQARPLTAIRLPLKPREESGMEECAPRSVSRRAAVCRHRRR